MGSFLAVIGFLGFIVFIIMAIVSAFRKTGKGKKRMLYAAGCFVLLIMGAAISPDTKDTAEPANATPKVENKKEVSSKQKAADEAKKVEDAKNKAAADAKKKAEDEAAAKKKADEEAAAAKKAAEEKAKQIQPGTYEVGKDVQPGLYRTDGDISYWARLKGLSGDLNEIIANGNPIGPDVIQILPTDKAFETQGSGFWTKIDDTYKPQMLTSFGDGTYIVGRDIAPGKYKSEGGDMGYWARLSGFTGDMGNILANANPQGPTIVVIKPTDKGFQTSGNGTWTKVQ
jgi:hypothetical protein